mgnify:FL=1
MTFTLLLGLTGCSADDVLVSNAFIRNPGGLNSFFGMSAAELLWEILGGDGQTRCGWGSKSAGLFEGEAMNDRGTRGHMVPPCELLAAALRIQQGTPWRTDFIRNLVEKFPTLNR